MKLQRVAIVLTTLGAVAGLGMSTASAATLSQASPMNHHDWCYAQHWQAGDSHWRQCDDVVGWWNHSNRPDHPDHHRVSRPADRDRRH